MPVSTIARDSMLVNESAGNPELMPREEVKRSESLERIPISRRRIAVIVSMWMGIALGVVALVFVGVGPMLAQRDQHNLLTSYRTQVEHAANEASGLAGVTTPTKAPNPGSPVGIIEIGRFHLRQVVVEGVSPQQTRRGPGHVPGTAGLGQPGNSAIVGRRAGYGGVFRVLPRLRKGDLIVVTTTQGQSLYAVTRVRDVALQNAIQPDSVDVSSGSSAISGVRTTSSAKLGTNLDDIYAPTDGDRLTLVTSGSALPFATNRASVVEATMVGKPFTPTPQNGRTTGADGRSADGSGWTYVVLALFGVSAAITAAVVLFRRFPFRSAYVLAAPILVVAALLFGEAALLLVPAWA